MEISTRKKIYFLSDLHLGAPDAASSLQREKLAVQFLDEIKGMRHKTLALELLRKILNDELKTRSKFNLIQSRKLSEMLESAIKKYQNKLLTAVEIINEVIEIAKEVREAEKRGENLRG